MGACDLVLRDVAIPGGRRADLSIRDGLVVHVGEGLPGGRVISCRDRIVVPAGIDMHVHMRDGTQAAKEDWRSGTMSAVAGGVTVVVDQPNTVPPLETGQLVADRVRLALDKAVCGFAVNGAVTGRADLGGLWESGVMAFGEIFAASSSYGGTVSRDTLAASFARISTTGALATVHAEEPDASAPSDLRSHDRSRPASGEIRAVRQVSRLNTAGARLHFCHLSAAGSLAAAAGSTEATPHHLFLSRERFRDSDPQGKVNPPLRDERTRKRLLAAWDRIDVIASDHAPHTAREKSLPFADAPAGMPGVETMIPLLIAQVLRRRLTLPSVIAKCALRPATLLGITPGGFKPGCRGDYAIFPKAVSRIDPDLLHSRAGWTPFCGQEAVFPEVVVAGGCPVYEDREFPMRRPVWYAGRGYNVSERTG